MPAKQEKIINYELESKTNLEGYSDYEKRIYGFIAERLLNVWILHNELNVFNMGVINTEQKQNLTAQILTGSKRSLLFTKQYGIFSK